MHNQHREKITFLQENTTCLHQKTKTA